MADNREKRTVGAGIVVTALLALTLLFMGTALIAHGFCLMKRPVDTADVYWTDITENDVIRTDGLRVIDPFLTTSGPLGKTVCCLASFCDKSGDMCVGVITATEGSGLSDALDRYENDANAALGAFLAQGYFTVAGMDGLGVKFNDAYADACRTYGGALSQLSERYYNGSVRETTLCFTYLCGANENYLAVQGRKDTVSGVIGIVVAGFGALGTAAALAGAAAARKKDRIQKEDI